MYVAQSADDGNSRAAGAGAEDIEADRDEREEKMQRRLEGKRAGEADDAGEGDRGAVT